MTRLGGANLGSSAPVRVNVAKVRVPLSTVVIASLARRVWAGIWFLIRRPVLLLALALLVLGWRVTLRHGPVPVSSLLALTSGSRGGGYGGSRSPGTSGGGCVVPGAA